MKSSRNVAGNIGVLALQGDVSEHIIAFSRAMEVLGLEGRVIPVLYPADLDGLIGLAIPGGESTTISKMVQKNRLYDPIRLFQGGIFATCAGMVLVATNPGDPRIHPLGLIEMEMHRNAFGSQKDSFEADIPFLGLDGRYHAIFIRAPVARTCGREIEILSRIDQGIVAVRSGKHIALAFHPELSNDTRIHCIFLANLTEV